VNNNGEEAFRREFTVRYRLPRPLSRSYESVLFARHEGEVQNKITWCARVAVRFIAALRQALYLSADPSASVNPPGERDLKLPAGDSAFDLIIHMPSPVSLLQLAGIYPGVVNRDDRSSLLSALEDIAFLSRYRIVAVEQDGLRVLLGPRMEYFIWNVSPPGGFDPGTPLLVDTVTGHFVSLSPLMIWFRDPHRPLGNLMILRSIRGAAGRYMEDGVPGAPALEQYLAGHPVNGRLAEAHPAFRQVRDPDVRFADQSMAGEFAVQGVVWKGSMSDIFLAWNRKLNDPALLKTFENRGGGFDENYWRFVNEEKFTAGLSHPGVVKPHRASGEGFGIYYAEEFVSGGSLNDVMEDIGVLPVIRAKDIALRLLEILDHIHAKGIVHNDIKPDNILFDQNGGVKVIDFGIASDIRHESGDARGGVRVGSQGYMAPELREGGPPSVQSDIYALGVVLAQMLSCRLPGSYEEAAAHPSIPVAYHEFFRRCLSAGPAGRYGSAREAAADLAAIDADQQRSITFDIEGTLVTNYGERHPRPGLHDFMEFIMNNFDRIFIYTLLTAEQTREVFDHLRKIGAVPDGFIDRYEYVEWPRGSEGTIKDLRRCGVPLEHNAIVDDMYSMVPEDQMHRWVAIPDYNSPGMVDNGFVLARNEIIKKFRLQAGC
jgi:serine/threonine protein kinase